MSDKSQDYEPQLNIIDAIKADYVPNVFGYNRLAKKYGLTRGVVRKILNGDKTYTASVINDLVIKIAQKNIYENETGVAFKYKHLCDKLKERYGLSASGSDVKSICEQIKDGHASKVEIGDRGSVFAVRLPSFNDLIFVATALDAVPVTALPKDAYVLVDGNWIKKPRKLAPAQKQLRV